MSSQWLNGKVSRQKYLLTGKWILSLCENKWHDRNTNGTETLLSIRICSQFTNLFAHWECYSVCCPSLQLLTSQSESGANDKISWWLVRPNVWSVSFSAGNLEPVFSMIRVWSAVSQCVFNLKCKGCCILSLSQSGHLFMYLFIYETVWEFFSNSHLETLPFYSWEHECSFSLQKSCCDTNLHRTENMLMLPSVLSNLEHLQLGVKQSIWIQMQHFSESYEKLFSNLTEKNQTKWSCRMLVEISIVIAQSKSLKDCNRGWNIFVTLLRVFFFQCCSIILL